MSTGENAATTVSGNGADVIQPLVAVIDHTQADTQVTSHEAFTLTTQVFVELQVTGVFIAAQV